MTVCDIITIILEIQLVFFYTKNIFFHVLDLEKSGFSILGSTITQKSFFNNSF